MQAMLSLWAMAEKPFIRVEFSYYGFLPGGMIRVNLITSIFPAHTDKLILSHPTVKIKSMASTAKKKTNKT